MKRLIYLSIFIISIPLFGSKNSFNGKIQLRYENTQYYKNGKKSDKKFSRITTTLSYKHTFDNSFSYLIELNSMQYIYKNKKSKGYASFAQAYLNYKFNDYNIKLGRFFLNKKFAPFLYTHRRDNFLSMQYDGVALSKKSKNSKYTFAYFKSVIKQKNRKSLNDGLYLLASRYNFLETKINFSLYYMPKFINNQLYSIWGSVQNRHYGLQALFSKEKSKKSTYAIATYYKNRVNNLKYKITLGVISNGLSTINLYKSLRDQFKKSYRNIKGGFWCSIPLMFGSYANGLTQKIVKIDFKYKTKSIKYYTTIGYDKSSGKNGFYELGAIFGIKFKLFNLKNNLNYTIYQKHQKNSLTKRERLQWNIVYNF